MTASLNEHSLLIERVMTWTEQDSRFSTLPIDDGAEPSRFGFQKASDKRARPVIVTAEDMGLELGAPGLASISSLLWTNKKGLLEDGIQTAGRDFPKAHGEALAFGLLIMVQVDAGFDPTGPNFQSLKNLSNRLPGYMGRSMPGKLWVRLHRDLLAKGFSMSALGQCLALAYREAVPELRAVRVVLVSGENDLLKEMDSCDDLDCSSCDEQETCDIIRDLIVRRNS
ncbi:MAG: hypothetical protein JRF33_18415 [Deltaproteobacteria bacterium]|nr:hypothetical protein [Deltaproteobacteria bacterium]